jgi:molybdopterin-binding protein
MRLKAENIFKSFGTKNILDGVSAVFEAGAMNVVVGPNGAGKTTLLKTASLLEKPSAGRILIDGKPSSEMSGKEKLAARRRIGFSFQNPFFFRGSVVENLIYGLKVRGIKPTGEKIDKTLAESGLADKRDTEAAALSGGEKQRLSIARASVTEPDCLIFDEPTANLDPVAAARTERLILHLSGRGKTTIVTTHNMAQARKLGGRIFFMSRGRVAASAPADEFFAKPANLEAAEYTFAENVFEGEVVKKNSGLFLETSGVDIELSSDGFAGGQDSQETPAEKTAKEKVYGILRAEDIFVSLDPIKSSARNSFKAEVKKISPMGRVYSLEASVGKAVFETVVTKQSVESLNLQTGAEVYLTFKATAMHLIRK